MPLHSAAGAYAVFCWAMSWSIKQLTAFVQNQFEQLGDDEKSGPMAAYMKTEMPFYGIQKPDRVPVYREMKRRFPAETQKQYEDGVKALWKLPHREEKYAALEFAQQNKKFVRVASFPLYETLIRTGAWWDLVDDIATNLISESYLRERGEIESIIERWIDDDDMWIRRTAILSHNRHRGETDWKQLSNHCLRRAGEKEFFIRKAIGWALREYSYPNPKAVKSFLLKNQAKLSPLSFKEGAKRLVREGYMEI